MQFVSPCFRISSIQRVILAGDLVAAFARHIQFCVRRMRGQANRRRHNASNFPEKVLHDTSGSGMHITKHREKQHEFHEVSSQKMNDEASPSKHLWIGNIASSVSETTLAEQFSRFGDIENLKIYSSRNYAFVSLKTIEDAIYAKKGLHGTSLGGLAIRIEFAKGDGNLNKEPHVDGKDLLYIKVPSDSKFMVNDEELGHREASQVKDISTCVTSDSGSKQTPVKQKENKKGEESEVLWIGFPLHLKIDEEKLYKHFSCFGGIEKITTFPGRTYAFVRFHNSNAASRAKDALQGKLFDDPRVSISFAKSEVGPMDHSQGTNKAYSNESSDINKRKIKQPPFSNANKNAGSNIFLPSSTRKRENGMRGSPLLHRKDDIVIFEGVTYSQIGRSFNLDFRMSDSPHPKYGIDKNISQGNPRNDLYWKDESDNRLITNHEEKLDIQADQWKRRLQNRMQKRRHGDCHADELSFNYGSSKPKRIRLDHNEANQSMAVDGMGLWKDDTRVTSLWGAKYANQDGYHTVTKEKNSQIHLDFQEMHKMSLVERMRSIPSMMEDAVKSAGLKDRHEGVGLDIDIPSDMQLLGSNPNESVGLADEQGHRMNLVRPAPKDVFRWEGTIAKGSTLICHCRCFPATKEIDVRFPDILNYTARTSLDVLAKYVTDVKTFGIVLFMPQGVTDVAPYQDLMAFLADKRRAAVCNISEEVTLFLVPPSDFVEKFLKVPKSNNILGVVLGQQHLRSHISLDEADQVVFSDRRHALDNLEELSYRNCNAVSEHVMDKSRVLFHDPDKDQNKMVASLQEGHVLGNRRKYENHGDSPALEDLHVTGNSNLPLPKTQSHQDTSHTLHMQTFLSNQQQPKQPAKSSLLAPQNLILAQAQQFSYVAQNSVSENFDQGRCVPSSDKAFEQTQSASNPQPQDSLVSLVDVQPGHSLAWDQQTVLDVEEQRTLVTHTTRTAENQGQVESEDGQKKFKATLELAAALLKQLQKQTKVHRSCGVS